MLSDEQIRRESRSRIYLSQKSEDEKDRFEMEILERFSKPNNRFPPEQMDDLCLLIRKLRDCAYIRCGVNKDLEETYKTTDSGMDYLRRLGRVVNRCGSGDGFPPLSLPVPVRDDAGLASAPDQLHEHVGELMIEDPVLILRSE